MGTGTIMSDYIYIRTNSRGEKKFRRYTGETIADATAFLNSKGIFYTESRGDHPFLWIDYEDRTFCYYPTTGRWNSKQRGIYPNKHYSSKGIEDFYYRYLTGRVESTLN